MAEFYAALDYPLTVRPGDRVLLAEADDEIIGAARLCDEEGSLVLRGMSVVSNRQRQGVGTALLRGTLEAIGEGTCYSIPYSHLQGFYGQVGFRAISPADAPRFLQDRLGEYKRGGLDVILMRRPSSPTSGRDLRIAVA